MSGLTDLQWKALERIAEVPLAACQVRAPTRDALERARLIERYPLETDGVRVRYGWRLTPAGVAALDSRRDLRRDLGLIPSPPATSPAPSTRTSTSSRRPMLREELERLAKRALGPGAYVSHAYQSPIGWSVGAHRKGGDVTSGADNVEGRGPSRAAAMDALAVKLAARAHVAPAAAEVVRAMAPPSKPPPPPSSSTKLRPQKTATDPNASRELDRASAERRANPVVALPDSLDFMRAPHRAIRAVVDAVGQEAPRALYAAFDDFNRQYFAGELAAPLILISPAGSPRAEGDYCEKDTQGLQSRIRIAPFVMKRGARYVLDVLLHEMVHAWQAEIEEDGENGYKGHGPKFAGKCNDISRSIGIGGTITGLVGVVGRGGLPDCARWPTCVRPAHYYPPMPEKKARAPKPALAAAVATNGEDANATEGELGAERRSLVAAVAKLRSACVLAKEYIEAEGEGPPEPVLLALQDALSS